MDEEIGFRWSPRWMQGANLPDVLRHCLVPSPNIVDRPACENPPRCVEVPAKPPLVCVARSPQLLCVGESKEERIPAWIEAA